jgi:hypothetical protein
MSQSYRSKVAVENLQRSIWYGVLRRGGTAAEIAAELGITESEALDEIHYFVADRPGFELRRDGERWYILAEKSPSDALEVENRDRGVRVSVEKLSQ